MVGKVLQLREGRRVAVENLERFQPVVILDAAEQANEAFTRWNYLRGAGCRGAFIAGNEAALDLIYPVK